MGIVHSHTATVRDYHYYKQFQKPIKNEQLRCLHEKFNFYDSFAVKTVRQNGETAGHLQRELSRVIIFVFLDRVVSMHIKLSSRHYKRSSLVQGGMQLPSIVFFSMPSTLKNAQLAERYLQLVKECYSKPANEKILGSFIAKAFSEPLASRTEG